MQHIDTSGMVNAPSDAGSTQPGFTVWPAQSPGTDSFESSNGGTEYFLSSNAADEATHPKVGTGGDHTSSQIVVWTLTNTSSLNTATPNLSLSNQAAVGEPVRAPPKQQSAGVGHAAGPCRSAGVLHQQHHNGDHRGRRAAGVCSSPPSRRTTR